MKKISVFLVFCLICFNAVAGEDFEDIYTYVKSLKGLMENTITGTLEVESTSDMVEVMQAFKADIEKNIHHIVYIRNKYGTDNFQRNDHFPEKLNNVIDEFNELVSSSKTQKADEIIETYSDDPLITEITDEIEQMMMFPERYVASKLDFKELAAFLERYYRLTEKTMIEIDFAGPPDEVAKVLTDYYTAFEKIIDESEEIEKKYPIFVFDDNMEYKHYDLFPEEVRRIIDDYKQLEESKTAEKAEVKLDLYSDVEEISEIIWKIEELRDRL